jgi:Spy/CpxP family protein refolding chaperone
MKLGSFLLSIFAAGILSAQTATAPVEHHHRVPGGQMMQRLSSRFSLTVDQQQQAKTIFQQSREQMKALAPKLKEERQAVASAVKTDNEKQIDQVLQSDASLNAQARAIHAKAMAKFYQILTPEQKAKFDQGARTHRSA